MRVHVIPPFVRRAFVAAAALALLLPASGASAARGPLAEAEARVAAARRAANEAAQRYADAETQYYALDNDIRRTRESIEVLRADAARIRGLAQARAVEAYKGGSLELGDIIAADDVLDSMRRTELLNRVNAEGNDAVDQLGALTEELTIREEDLTTQLSDQQDLLDELHEREHELRDALTRATREEEALRQRLAREAAARDAQARAQQGGGNVRGGAGQVIVSGNWVCPVQGARAFSDSWGDPRSGGRRHQGVDIMSGFGTPVVAVVGGVVQLRSGGLGGLAIWLRGNDGHSYYYAHLQNFVGGARSVSGGEMIGTVGNSGNARGGPAHLHFEIHPGGGGAVNPYPTVRTYC